MAQPEPRIDAHIDAVPDPHVQALLQRLREVIATAAPEAVEGWSYAMPAFRYRDRPLVAFAGAKAWAGFYPMSGELVERHHADLAGFSTAKGTIRITPESGVPEELVATIVRERMAQVDAKARKR